MSDSLVVIGKSGQVATSLKKWIPSAQFIGSADWDLSEEGIYGVLSGLQPKIVINAAAYTAVDRAETERNQCLTLNAHLPEWLAKWCKGSGAFFLHYSTDYVYGELTEGQHVEDEKPSPLNYYGETKQLGEAAISYYTPHSAILRISWIYSDQGQNFLKTMLRLASEREILNVVADQYGAPTTSDEIAQVSRWIVEKRHLINGTDIFNYAPKGETNWFEFASEIFREAKARGAELKVNTVHPILSSQYPTPAARTKNSRMDCTKFDTQFLFERPHWRFGLKNIMEILYGNHTV